MVGSFLPASNKQYNNSYSEKFSLMRLIHRQEMWVPTLQGWLVILVGIVAVMLVMVTRIYSFLALNSPVKADVLVVEGWMPDYAIKSAISEFERGGYQKLITIGSPITHGYYLAQYKTFAELSAATLMALGFDPDKLVTIPVPEVTRNRTLASAIALRQWIVDSGVKIEAINLYSLDVHARRSWLILKQALSPEIKVGVIAVEPDTYDPKKWWVSSSGVRFVISETIAYIYARFIDWTM
jgi:hypothetical protein